MLLRWIIMYYMCFRVSIWCTATNHSFSICVFFNLESLILMHSSISIFYHIFEKENMDHSVSSSGKVHLQLLFIHLTIIREHLFVPRLSPKNITSYYDGKNLCILTTEIKRMSPLPGYGMFNWPLIYCLLKYWCHGYFLYNLLISASVFTTSCSSARYLML